MLYSMDNSTMPESLNSQLARALEMIELAGAEAAASIASGPDNPAIKRIGAAGFAELRRRDGWDVFRHDWVSQYRFAAGLIRGKRFTVLRDLLAAGSVREPGYGLRQFAPEVIDRIRAITGDMRLAANLTGAPSTTAVGSMPDEFGVVERVTEGGAAAISHEPRQLRRRRP